MVAWRLIAWTPGKADINTAPFRNLNLLYWICVSTAALLVSIGAMNVLSVIFYDLGGQEVLWSSLLLVAVAFGLHRFGRGCRRMSKRSATEAAARTAGPLWSRARSVPAPNPAA